MILTASLLLIASATPDPEQPVFTFREHRAGANYNMEADGLKKCKQQDGVVTCTNTFDVVAGYSVITMFKLANRQLYRLSVIGKRAAYPSVLRAFRKKYGEACKIGTATLNNRVGGQFQSVETTWCFKTGELVLSERAIRVDHFVAQYTDHKNKPPEIEPTVDF